MKSRSASVILLATAVAAAMLAGEAYAKPSALRPDYIGPRVAYNFNQGFEFKSGDGINFSTDANNVGDTTPDQPLKGGLGAGQELGVDLGWNLSDRTRLNLGLGYLRGSASMDDTSYGSQTFSGSSQVIGDETKTSIDWTGYGLGVGLEHDLFYPTDRTRVRVGAGLDYKIVDGNADFESHNSGTEGEWAFESTATGNASLKANGLVAKLRAGVDWVLGRHSKLSLFGEYGLGELDASAGNVSTTTDQRVTRNGATVAHESGQQGDGDLEVSGFRPGYGIGLSFRYFFDRIRKP